MYRRHAAVTLPVVNLTRSIQLATLLVAFVATTQAQDSMVPTMAGVEGGALRNVEASRYQIPLPHYVPGPKVYHHSSTAAEGYARGQAALTQARGEYSLLTAEARAANQEAYRRGIENQHQRVDTYFALKEKNREERTAERRPRATTEQLRRIAAAARPAALSASELDSATGAISWPTLLEREEFEPYRSDLEELFARRANGDKVAADDLQDANVVAKGMLAELKSHVKETPSYEYTAVRRFVESLAYEAQQPMR